MSSGDPELACKVDEAGHREDGDDNEEEQQPEFFVRLDTISENSTFHSRIQQ